MERKTTEELKLIMAEVAQELTSRIVKDKKGLLIPFPRGHIRTLGTLKKRWPYLPNSAQRTLACTLQLCDINRWHLNVWKISLTAGTVWEWHCTLPVISVMETLCYSYGIHCCGFSENLGFKKVINKLHSESTISNKLRDDLHELRELRNEVHLFLKEWVDLYDDKPKRYNKAVVTLAALEKSLKEHWSKVNA